MTELIFKLSSLIGRLSAQNMTPEQREDILREIHELIADYFQETAKKEID
ncbi:MAG TPA: hypothetical protein PL048_05120 [Leptospiraceae bacterium]|nr:hypothetical protein [Leptospiraceae bacterium]